MAWNKKKLLIKLGQYLENKKIPYEVDDEKLRVKLSLCFKECGYMLYPYISIEGEICSININVAEHPAKGYNYDKLNTFNRDSKLFKAYLTEQGIVTLEYRFVLYEIDSSVFDAILDSLYALEFEIDTL